MREHFRDRHPDDTIVVQQEGLYPRCVRCNMFVQNVGTAHQATKTCQKATSRRERQKVATQHAEMKANVVFTVNGKPIEIVEEFVYLGRLVTKDDKDGPAVMRNLARARAKWASMRRFLVRDAADPGDVLQDSGSLCTSLRKRILGTDRRFDETTSKFS